MSRIDVRSDVGNVTIITFADDTQINGNTIACELRKCSFNGLEIHDSDDYLVIPTKADAVNLILALQKAIELKWIS